MCYFLEFSFGWNRLPHSGFKMKFLETVARRNLEECLTIKKNSLIFLPNSNHLWTCSLLARIYSGYSILLKGRNIANTCKRAIAFQTAWHFLTPLVKSLMCCSCVSHLLDVIFNYSACVLLIHTNERSYTIQELFSRMLKWASYRSFVQTFAGVTKITFLESPIENRIIARLCRSAKRNSYLMLRKTCLQW